jgi:predicted lipoprotein
VAKAAHAQSDAWSAFCADRKHGNADTLKQAYNDLGDAWARIEFLRTGPAAVALRVERFNWWLDRTNATGKALDQMLASKDTLTPDSLASGSVAGQGLPIVERLLYAPGAPASLKGKQGKRRCEIGVAVAQGQAAIADAIAADWSGPDGARASLAANTRWQVAFADATEAADVMLTDIASALEGLKDYKAAMYYHDILNANAKAPHLAEAIFSGRTGRDLELNLAALREAVASFTGPATEEDRKTLDKLFDDAAATLKEVETAAPAERVPAAQRMLAAYTALAQNAIRLLPQMTGLHLGFNNLDGD